MKPRGKPVPQRDGTVTWRADCPKCYKPAEVSKLDPFAVRKWIAGEFIQDAFPQLSAADREILISGMHGECYDQWFPDL